MRAAHCVGVLILLLAWEAQAQRPPIPPMDPRYFRVDFIIPGARPSGLAGAFIGAAMDEHSSSINPAGMTYLRRPSISTHQRWSHLVYEEPEGSPENPDATREFHTDSFEQSMANLIYPIDRRFAVSLFREVPVNSHFEFETQPFLTTTSSVTERQVFGGLGSFPGRRVDLDLELVDDGLALAYAPTPRIGLGFAFRLSFMNLRLSEQVFLDPALRSMGAPRQNSAETLYSFTTLDDTEIGPSYDFGFLANLIQEKLFLGAVARVRPRYTFHSDIYTPEIAADSLVLPAQWIRASPFEFSIPDSQGFGLYYAATDRLRFALDVARIEYSDLLDGNSTNAVADDSLDSQTGTYTDPDGQPDLVADDEYEVHFGVEFLAKIPGFNAIVPMRAGAFTNPGHRVYAASDDVDLRRLYPQAEDHIVFGFGVGIIQMGNFKLDTSVLLSEEGTSATGSAYVAF